METQILQTLTSKSPKSAISLHKILSISINSTTPVHIRLLRRQNRFQIRCINNETPSSLPPPPPLTPTPTPLPPATSTINPPESVEIRFRRGSRRRQRLNEDKPPVVVKAPPKKWEEMDTKEKAMELYVGEKGLLYWLNKLAYASIYIVIGGWILFRFVGPALNLYQLDTPVMSPTDVLKGSS